MTIIAAEMVGVPVLSGLLVLAVDCCGMFLSAKNNLVLAS